MGIELYWDNDEQTILLAEFDNQWTWDELHAVLRTVKKITAERSYEIGAIVDLTRGLRLPGGALLSKETFDNFKKILKMGDEGKGPVVVVGLSAMIKAVYDTVAKLDPKATEDVAFAKTQDEARAILHQRLARPMTA